VRLLEEHACPPVQVDDLSDVWTALLQRRLEMYRSLKDSTVAKFGLSRYEAYDDAYGFFVSLYERNVLGGVRITARKRAG